MAACAPQAQAAIRPQSVTGATTTCCTDPSGQAHTASFTSTRTVPKARTPTTLPKKLQHPLHRRHHCSQNQRLLSLQGVLAPPTIFRRPMHRGEYSHLLWQIRHRRTEHLIDDGWRVTLSVGRRTLAGHSMAPHNHPAQELAAAEARRGCGVTYRSKGHARCRAIV